jgi:NADPH:quinone reductase-like Zn-dependent oxidoreductase
MQAYRIHAGKNIEGLEIFEASPRSVEPHEVRVRVGAVSLNYRDLMVAHGAYPVSTDRPLIPCSDGAGEVLTVGAAVTRFKPGDRVAGAFFTDWIEGEPTPQKTAASLGAGIDGVLCEEVVLSENALVAIPTHFDFVEAATLPCAAVTAWNALFVCGDLKPGASVLLLGTGGVSIWALQLAKAAGLRAIITSSSDDKLERARALGADEIINYRKTPEWQDAVRQMTGGRGVDLVVEVGGQDTAPRSLAATRMGGTVAIIGGVSGFGGGLAPGALIFGAARACGIFVGSRAMFENLNRFVEINGIQPVVDRVFPFEQAREAYAHLASGQHFGKIAIRVGDRQK